MLFNNTVNYKITQQWWLMNGVYKYREGKLKYLENMFQCHSVTTNPVQTNWESNLGPCGPIITLNIGVKWITVLL